MTHEHVKKGEMRLIEMHIVLDAHGKIQVSPQLMEALGIQPGDMLSFYFDDNGVHVKGGEKPPYFHTSPDTPQSSQQSPRVPIPTPDRTDALQMHLFEPGSAKPPTRRKRQGT